MKEKIYTFEDIIEAVETERERTRIILEYIINKNSHPLPRGIDYKKFFDEIQDFEDSLLN